jgi:GTP-binding protein HflX
VLEEIGAGATPRILVMNKTDMLPEGVHPVAGLDGVAVSALTGKGLGELQRAVADFFKSSREEVAVTLSAARGDLVAMARRDGEVLSEEYRNGQVMMRALVSRPVAGRLRKAAISARGTSGTL